MRYDMPTGMTFSASITNLYVSSELGPHTHTST